MTDRSHGRAAPRPPERLRAEDARQQLDRRGEDQHLREERDRHRQREKPAKPGRRPVLRH